MVILMVLGSAAVVGAGIFVGSGLAVALIRFRVRVETEPPEEAEAVRRNGWWQR
jgi:hypothetical protein